MSKFWKKQAYLNHTAAEVDAAIDAIDAAEIPLQVVMDEVTAVTYDNDTGATIEGTCKFTPEGADHDIEIIVPIMGSSEIVCDANETDDGLELHLDNDITNKLARALVTPATAPAETKLVAVDSTNAQAMIEAGVGIGISGSFITNEGVNYTTTAPTAANTDGSLKFVVLSSEPATKYDGYIYLITEA